jgi:hypothetical protein
MLRAGSSLQFNLVAALLENMGLGIRHGEGHDTDAEWFSHPALAFWAQDPKTYHVVKKVIYNQELDKVQDGQVWICYIYRDIRDVAASAKERWGVHGDRWEGLLQQLDDALRVYNTLHDMPGVLSQRYEDVMRDTRCAVREMAQFLGISPSQEIIEAVVRQCSIESMLPTSSSRVQNFRRVMRNVLGRTAQGVKRVLPPPLNGRWGLRKLLLTLFPKRDPRTLIGPGHISSTRGAIGTWRHKLNQAEQEIIAARYKTWLARTGYAVEE